MSANDVNPWNEISSVSAGEPMPQLPSLDKGRGARDEGRACADGRPTAPAASSAPLPPISPAATGDALPPIPPTSPTSSVAKNSPTTATGDEEAPAGDASPASASAVTAPIAAADAPSADSTPAANMPAHADIPTADDPSNDAQAVPSDAGTPLANASAHGDDTQPASTAAVSGADTAAGPANPVPPFDPTAAPAPADAPVTGGMVAALVLAVISIFFSAFPIATLPLAIGVLVAIHRIKRTGTRHTVLTVAKVCAIVGIVFSLFTGVIWAFTAALLLNGTSSVASFITENTEDEGLPLTEEEAEVASVVTDELDRIAAKDTDYLTILDEDLRATFQEDLGITPEDLGLDPNLYPNWMLLDFNYTVDEAYVTDDGTAVVFVDVTTRDPYDLITRWNELTDDIPEPADDEEAIELLRLALLQAMADDCELTSTYVAVELTFVDGAWEIDEASWDEAVSDMLLF